MKIKGVLILAAFLVAIQHQAVSQSSQPENEHVRKTIDRLFDGMRINDSTMVRSAFDDGAIMQTIIENEEGAARVVNGSLEHFLKAVASPKQGMWDEQITNYIIRTDGALASAWTHYRFYLGEEFSHCGVNSFQLVLKEAEWKIFHIVDTRRTSNCLD